MDLSILKRTISFLPLCHARNMPLVCKTWADLLERFHCWTSPNHFSIVNLPKRVTLVARSVERRVDAPFVDYIYQNVVLDVLILDLFVKLLSTETAKRFVSHHLISFPNFRRAHISIDGRNMKVMMDVILEAFGERIANAAEGEIILIFYVINAGSELSMAHVEHIFLKYNHHVIFTFYQKWNVLSVVEKRLAKMGALKFPFEYGVLSDQDWLSFPNVCAWRHCPLSFLQMMRMVEEKYSSFTNWPWLQNFSLLANGMDYCGNYSDHVTHKKLCVNIRDGTSHAFDLTMDVWKNIERFVIVCDDVEQPKITIVNPPSGISFHVLHKERREIDLCLKTLRCERFYINGLCYMVQNEKIITVRSVPTFNE
jgi:hypothetical protein